MAEFNPDDANENLRSLAQVSEQNPLKKYFRQPKVYITLPSKGRFYNPDSIDMPESQELPVFAMTARDELTMQTPDALLNGQATVDLIKSCMPNILDPWQMPSIDLDASLIAIRIATYGEEMDITTKEPGTGEEKSFAVDLRQLLNKLVTVEYDNNRLSAQLGTAAKLISGGMYSPFYVVYQGGYDTHADQLNRQGLLLSELSNAINNFYVDLENQGLSDKVVIMTTSEFGRRPYQNGGEGTDHGTAAPMFLIGDSVNGGIIGSAPNLEAFDNNNNLFHEYDFRQIYASILNQHFGLSTDLINNALLNAFETLDVVSTSNNQIGDINLDGQTNVVDIVIMVNFILGISTPTVQQFNAADINQDGDLNIVDVVTNISNILDQRVNSSIVSSDNIKIEQKNRLISISCNANLGGVEIHFRDNCKILDSQIDDSWIIRNHENKVILYSNDLKTMNQNFSFMLNKYSKIEKVIISDKKGLLLNARIYKK